MYCVFSIGRSLENNEQILKEKSMNKKSHSEILKELMEAKNIKAAQLARMADLPPTTIYSMLKRNNRNTEPETLAKISKALNIPISFWNTFLENDQIDDEKQIILASNFYDMLSYKGLSIEYVCHILQAFGFIYTSETLRSCIDEQISVPHPVVVLINKILMQPQVLTFEDYIFIQKFNSFSERSKDVINEMMAALYKAEAYEDQELNDCIDKIKSQREIE